jgi:hypothetical protein
MHPRLKMALDVSGALYDAAEFGAKYAKKSLKHHFDPRFHHHRRPGPHSPLWNALAAAVRAELRPWGAKARLARFLGIPKQRLTDFLVNPTRIADGEVTLQLANWLAHKRAGRDLSV